MKIRIFFIGFCVIALFGAVAFASATADPTEIGVGARPLGLGKAYVGFTGDANTIFINPAGHADIDGLKITSMSGQLLQEWNYFVFGMVHPYDFGNVGIGYVGVGLGSIPVTGITGPIGSEEVVPYGATDYSASVILLSYSNDLDRIPLFGDIDNVSYGLNFKYFTQGFAGGGVTMEGASGTGFDMDIGIQYMPSAPWVVGITLVNALPESMGGKFTWVRNNVVENIPSTLKVGTKAKVFGKEDSIFNASQDLYVGVDMDYFPTQDKPSVLHIGGEWWMSKVMALRVGIDQKPQGLEGGYGVENNLTAGIGIKSQGFTFDYSYHQYSGLDENITHYFSIGYIGIEDKEPRMVQEPKVILPVIVPKPNLVNFWDVPDGYWAKGPIEFMATLGVMNGLSDGAFKPEAPVTRAQLAEILIKLKEIEPNDLSSSPYPDVQKDRPEAKYIKAASYLGLLGPYPDGSFQPDKNVTRVEGVITITRFESIKPSKIVNIAPYPDVPKWHWAAGSISAAKSKGYLDYLIGQNKFDMNKYVSRAEVAEMLSKTEYGRKRIRKLIED